LDGHSREQCLEGYSEGGVCGFASISYDGEHASEPEDLPHVQRSDGEGASELESRISCVQSGVCGDGASEPEDRSHVQRSDGEGASEPMVGRRGCI
jgi:hypothetical protein